MKTLALALVIFIGQSASAVEFQCFDRGLEKVSNAMGYNSTKDFLKENDLIFSCKTKEQPDLEIFQWGDGSGLVGIEFEVVDGKCIISQEPYTGQDDGDLDLDWAQSYCQDFKQN